MTTTTARSATPQQQIAILKHLIGGKDFDAIAEILRLPRDHVVDFARTHGYPDPDKMSWAVDVLSKKLTDAETTLPAGRPHADVVRHIRDTPTPPRPAAAAGPVPGVAKPDEIRVLLNTAKAHPSKRIQSAADRVFDQLDKLRALIREDQEKNAAKRAAAAEKAKARAEIERLERELAAAKAKLRGTTPTTKTATSTSSDASEVPAKTIRAWAAENDIECPAAGRIPGTVRAAYDDAHRDGAA